MMYSSQENNEPDILNNLSKHLCPEKGNRRVALSCGHNNFHQKCMSNWMQTSGRNNCPVCRAEVTNKD